MRTLAIPTTPTEGHHDDQNRCVLTPSVQRPRVAALGLTEQEVAVLARYEGTIHEAPTLFDYLNGDNARSFAETDLIVGRLTTDGTYYTEIPSHLHLLMIEGAELYFPTSGSRHSYIVESFASSMYEWVPVEGSGYYKSAIDQLQLPSSEPLRLWIVDDEVIDEHQSLANASDGNGVAIRYIRRSAPRQLQKHSDGTTIVVTKADEASSEHGIGVGMPTGGTLEHWYPAFLRDVHERNNNAVPIAPPALPLDLDWATIDERALIAKAEEIDATVEILREESRQVRAKLDKLWNLGRDGERASLFTDGEQLGGASA